MLEPSNGRPVCISRKTHTHNEIPSIDGDPTPQVTLQDSTAILTATKGLVAGNSKDAPGMSTQISPRLTLGRRNETQVEHTKSPVIHGR